MKKLIYILTSALALVLSIISYGQDRKKVETLLIDAVARIDNQDINGAVQILEPLSQKAPDNDAVRYYLGLCYSYSGEFDKASTCFREAARLDSSNYWYKERLARIYSAARQPELAVGIYEDLIRDYPKNTELYYTLVQIYMQQNKVDKVLSTLDEIDAVSGKNEMTTLYKFDVLVRAKREEEAYRVLEEYNNEYASAQVLAAMGDYNISQLNDTLAMKYYKESLSYESDCIPALIGLSEVYRYKRQFSDFFGSVGQLISSDNAPVETKTRYLTSLFQRADPQFVKNFRPQIDSIFLNYYAKAPQDSMVLQTLCSWYYASARNDKALEAIRKNCDLYPTSLGARGMYVQLLSMSRNWSELKDVAEKSYSDFPDEPGFLEMKTAAEFYLKDYDSYIEDVNRLVEAAPGDTSLTLRAYSGLGDAYHLKGEMSKAFAAYEKALKINRNYLPVLNNYAYYLSMENKKLKKAYSMSKLTIEAEPDNPTYLDTFGWILFLQGKPLEAKAFFKHAMLYGGKESPAVLDHYAEVLYALKEYDMAKVYWNMAQVKNMEMQVPDLDQRIKTRLEAVGK